MADREITVAQAEAALERFEAYMSKQLTRTHWIGNPERQHAYITARALWLDARRTYLKQVLTAAVNRRGDDRPAGTEPAGSRSIKSTHKEVNHG